MTEREWLSCKDPPRMLEWLRGSGLASERKLRLLACAAVRQIWHLLPDESCQDAVELAERLADGLVPRKDRKRGFQAAVEAVAAAREAESSTYLERVGARPETEFDVTPADRKAQAVTEATQAARATLSRDAKEAMEGAIWCVNKACNYLSKGESLRLEEVIRNLFGPLPFREVVLEPVWRTPSTLSLAQAIYDERSFDRLPELATALEHEGCDSAEVLEHLSSPGPQYLGTWSLDLVLGKEVRS